MCYNVLAWWLGDVGDAGALGATHLNEGEDEPHSEVREPVDTPSDHVGGWPGGLQEDLSDEQGRDGTCGRADRGMRERHDRDGTCGREDRGMRERHGREGVQRRTSIKQHQLMLSGERHFPGRHSGLQGVLEPMGVLGVLAL